MVFFYLYMYLIQKVFMRKHIKYHLQANKQNENCNYKIHFCNLGGGGAYFTWSFMYLKFNNNNNNNDEVIFKASMLRECLERQTIIFKLIFFSEHLNDFSTKESYFLNFVLNFFIKLYSIAIMKKINTLKRFYCFQLQIIDVLRC